MKGVVAAFAAHNINLTPAGLWEYNEAEQKKESIDAKRVDNLSWDRFPDDNMGRHFIQAEDNLLVLDIDGTHTIIEDDTISIPSLNLTLPLGLYTTTTQANKYHIYYKIDSETNKRIANRLIKLHGTQIDIFTYGVVFEGHVFSPFYKLHEGVIPECPKELIHSILEYQEEEDISATQTNGDLVYSYNTQRLRLIEAFLEEELKTTKQWNAFFKHTFPKEFMPNKAKKLDINRFDFSYDLFNKIAVKLTTAAELGFHEHALPVMNKLLAMWGKDPESKKTKKFLWQQILPSLPQHEARIPFSLVDDDVEFDEKLKAQKVDYPLFRVIRTGKMMYMEIDKTSAAPVIHGDSYFLDKITAQALHPEFSILNEEGRVIGWDDTTVPIIYYMNNPYKPQYELDPEHNRDIINLYTPTEYLKQAEARELKTPNMFMQVVQSTIGKEFMDLYLAYSAQIVFGHESPTMVLWIAALSTEKGGTGKSVMTLELFSLMLRSAASAVDPKTSQSGWGDVVVGVKVLSFEDKPEESQREWDATYSSIKQSNTNSYRKLNMKGGAMTTERVSLSITGSTNYRPKLPASDRRFWCIEPAHLHGLEDPLTEEEQLTLSRALSSYEYMPELQEYVNHLYYIYTQGFSTEVRTALFIKAPETPYRKKWVMGGATNSLNIINTLGNPDDLHALMKYTDLSKETLADLYSLLIHTYDKKTKKAAVSWKWFKEILPYVLAEKYREEDHSKAAIASMLHIDFTANVGDKYSHKWRSELPEGFEPTWAQWPAQGYVMYLSWDAVQEYQEIIKQLKGI